MVISRTRASHSADAALSVPRVLRRPVRSGLVGSALRLGHPHLKLFAELIGTECRCAAERQKSAGQNVREPH